MLAFRAIEQRKEARKQVNRAPVDLAYENAVTYLEFLTGGAKLRMLVGDVRLVSNSVISSSVAVAHASCAGPFILRFLDSKVLGASFFSVPACPALYNLFICKTSYHVLSRNYDVREDRDTIEAF